MLIATLIVLGLGAAFYLWGSAGQWPAVKLHQLHGPPLAPPPAGEEFALATFNVGYLSGLANNLGHRLPAATYRAHLAQVAAAWAAHPTDIICYQEIDLAARRSWGVQQSAELARASDYAYRAEAVNWDKNYVPFPYWPPTAHFGRVVSAQAIHSRWPLALVERVVFPKPAQRPFFYQAFYTDRLAQVCRVSLGKRAVVVINVHLEAFVPQARWPQLALLEQLYRRYAAEGPVIVAGDFNQPAKPPGQAALAHERLYETMLTWPHLQCVVPPGQWGQPQHFTFSTQRPFEQIDFIFYHAQHLECLASQVLPATGQASDHWPLWARFRFRS
ncbi:MAG: endonuclease/exonuclease/phosphatase family protein [Bernardetiaceae bacterium]|jgi:endonuclease/exonuclease/phosphatase family metal-dependent hydrolase|nr:endonuclease/exonuclease/phosphatase family protein [Bernardetiaceae bacterium]